MKRPKGAPKKHWVGPVPERHVCPVCKCEVTAILRHTMADRIRMILANADRIAGELRRCREQLAGRRT